MKTILTLLALGTFVLTGATHSDAAGHDKAKCQVKTTKSKAVKATKKQAKAVEVKKFKCISCPDKSYPDCPPCDDCP